VKAIAANALSFVFIDGAPKIDNLVDATEGGDFIKVALITITEKGFIGFFVHNIIGVEIIMCQIEHFAIDYKTHDNLK